MHALVVRRVLLVILIERSGRVLEFEVVRARGATLVVGNNDGGGDTSEDGPKLSSGDSPDRLCSLSRGNHTRVVTDGVEDERGRGTVRGGERVMDSGWLKCVND